MHPVAEGRFTPPCATYVDSASYGLPPRATVEAVRAALDSWASGTADWQADWDVSGDRCRPLAAALLGSRTEEVALIPAVSVGAALIFTQTGPGAEVLVPDDEFASVLLPALVSAQDRGVKVRKVPFAELAAEVAPTTTLVATSHVRSNDGRVQDLAAVAAAAKSVGAAVLVDATHSAGILPVAATELRLDYVLCAAYKHLLCPRGVGFMKVSEQAWPNLLPVAASWFSTKDRAEYYGPDLSALAGSAARYDVSLAWHAWVGAIASLEFLCSVTAEERASWSVGLASALAVELALPASGSSILTVPVSDGERVRELARARGIRMSGRGDDIRVSFHLYNDSTDVAKVVECLGPFVRRVGTARSEEHQ